MEITIFFPFPTDRMASLLPPQKKQLSMTVLPKREPFEILYRINCDNLCSDFKEDLEFRFSWGIVSLIQRFVGNKDKANAIALQNYNYTPMVLMFCSCLTSIFHYNHSLVWKRNLSFLVNFLFFFSYSESIIFA